MSEDSTRRPALEAVFWDMDGTLIDSEEYWFEGQTLLVEEYGGKWSLEQALQFVGTPLEDSAHILQKEGVLLDVTEIISRQLKYVASRFAEHIPYRPGVEELLQQCRNAGVKLALVTMTHSPLVEAVIDLMPYDCFDVVVTGDRVSRGKPDPEPYLLAFNMMKNMVPTLTKNNVVAIEDSSPGTKSAMAASLPTILIPNMIPVPTQLATVSWDSLEGKTLEDLTRVATNGI